MFQEFLGHLEVVDLLAVVLLVGLGVHQVVVVVLEEHLVLGLRGHPAWVRLVMPSTALYPLASHPPLPSCGSSSEAWHLLEKQQVSEKLSPIRVAIRGAPRFALVQTMRLLEMLERLAVEECLC